MDQIGNAEADTDQEKGVLPRYLLSQKHLVILFLSHLPIFALIFLPYTEFFWGLATCFLLNAVLRAVAEGTWSRKLVFPSMPNESPRAYPNWWTNGGPAPLPVRLRIVAGFLISLGTLGALWHFGFIQWFLLLPIWNPRLFLAFAALHLLSIDLRNVRRYSEVLPPRS